MKKQTGTTQGKGKPELPWKCSKEYAPYKNGSFLKRSSHPPTPAKAQHSPLPWILQNGAIYDASDNGRVQNVRLCKLVASSTAIEPQDAAYIVKACNAYPTAEKLAEAVKDMMHDLEIFYGKYRDRDNRYLPTLKSALAEWEGVQG